MARGRRRNRTESTKTASAPARIPLITWCTGGLVAMIVSTPLVTSEAYALLGTHSVGVMMWLILLIASLAAMIAEWRGAVRGGWPLLCFTGLVVVTTTSSVVMGPTGHTRVSINAAWQWLEFLVAFFLIRQLIRSPVAIRAVCSVGVATAVGLSAFGLYQYGVLFPALRAEYQRDPQQALRQAGVTAPPGSPQERHFIDRLASKEPTATFALTNSLAGFLAPWLIVAVGIAVQPPRDGRAKLLIPAVCAAAVISLVLALTKSRTAALATAAGFAALAAWHLIRGRWRSMLPAVGVAIAVVIVLGMVVVSMGGIDQEVLAEAPRSAVYRLEYWQATSSMIRDYPWLGCGPGNFKDYYTAYKLPQASETVTDPHHFLFEIWATSGSVAALLFVATMMTFFRNSWGAAGNPSTTAKAASASETLPIYFAAGLGVAVGMASGWVVGMPPDNSLIWTALPAGAATLWMLHGWVTSGSLPNAVLNTAIMTLLVNLLFAGGISYAGVALVLWTLMGLALNQRAEDQQAECQHMAFAGGLLVFAIGFAALCYFTLYNPVLKSSLFLDEGRARIDRDESRNDFLAAAHVDPYWSQPWIQLAHLALAEWQETGEADALAEFTRCCDSALAVDRRSSELYRQKGEWYMAIYAVTQLPGDAKTATQAFAQAVALYPNSGIARARLAWAWHLVGQPEEARLESQRALRLDTLNPHAEQKFENRTDLGRWSGAGGETVEQRMDQIRKTEGAKPAE